VKILRIATGGDGVGRLDDGMTVFVPRTAPGDDVTLTGLQRRRGFARARLDQVIEPGPDRVAPSCPHYTRDECGGCQLQHLSAEAQRQAKAAMVGDALRRIARMEVENPSVTPPPSDWAYRSRLVLHAANGRIGLRPLGRPSDAFDLDRCLIAEEPLQELWNAVSPRRELLPRRLTRLGLRVARDGSLHLQADVDGNGAWPEAPVLADALRQDGHAATLWLRQREGTAQRVAGPEHIAPVSSFEQVFPAMGERVRADAVRRLGAAAGDVVWDLYAGIGETTALLAAQGARVVSVEADADAVEWATAHGPTARRVAARVEDIVDTLPRPALAVTNPPRTGMDARAVAGLAAAEPRRIVYISCDPATLARDLSRLAGYRLSGLAAFDLFPQTAHVETVAVMERK
jgi:23S rRNA (uracil1939-C5)-methyltransferase